MIGEGGIGARVKEWSFLSSDPWLLREVRGISIPLIGPLVQGRYNAFSLAQLEKEATILIEEFALKGYIREVRPCVGQILSPIFLRPKSSGKWRLILDLSDLNKLVPDQKFQLESLDLLPSLLARGGWMVKVDLENAYYSCGIRPEDRKLLRFVWQGILWEYQVLPNGLKSAPFTFTKILKPVVGYLRSRGVLLIIYLDDIWITARDRDTLVLHIDLVISTLIKLGFLINWEKSVTIPTQHIEFLGFIINSIDMTYSISSEKQEKILELCHHLLSQDVVQVRSLASLLGMLQAADKALVVARLHYRRLQMFKIGLIKQHLSVQSHLSKAAVIRNAYLQTSQLTQEVKSEIRWWVENLIQLPPGPIEETVWDLEIFSDACLTGWGAWSAGEGIQGVWDPSLPPQQINALEFKAAISALRYFTEHLRDIKVRLVVDNNPVKFYIKKMGGTRSPVLLDLALQFWNLALARGLGIEVDYIPSAENIAADLYSRITIRLGFNWEIQVSVFHQVARRWGSPSIDLFASTVNRKVTRYLSWGLEREAVGRDAFSWDWDSEVLCYAFPSFNLVTRVLEKLKRHPGTTMILIAPAWKTRPWYPTLLEMSVSQPVMLGNQWDLILDHNSEPHELQCLGKLHLSAWLISSNQGKQRGFQKRCPKLWPEDGNQPPSRRTTVLGELGTAGAVKDRLIRFWHLQQK